MAQDAVEVYRAQPKRIGQMMQGQGAGLSRPVANSDKTEPRAKLRQEMSHALLGDAVARIEQMLYHHRLVTRRRREDGGGNARRLYKGIKDLAGQRLERLDPRQCRDIVIGAAEQDALQARDIVRKLDFDDLAPAVRQRVSTKAHMAQADLVSDPRWTAGRFRPLQAAGQHQYDQDDQNDPHRTAGTIAP